MKRATIFPMNQRAGLLAGLALLLACACGVCPAQFTGPAFGVSTPANQPIPATTDQAVLNPANTDPKISSGDILTVKLFGVLEYAPPVQVSVDGTIQLPLIGLVPISGLTIHNAETRIAEHLMKAGMYQNPQVTIQITGSPTQVATVTGEINGIVPIAGERHLLDVLAAASPGPMPPTASRIITVLRPGVPDPIVVDLGTNPTRSGQANITIFAHDTIIISRVGVVYVVGAFKNQGAIPLTQSSPLTLLEATSLSGGAGFEGKLTDVRILRSFGTERRIVPFDMAQVVKNRAPDPVLQADDIVFLPSSSVKAAIKGNGLGTLASLASLLIIGLQFR